MKFFGLIFMLLPLVFFGIGGMEAHKQAQKLARAVPVQAVVQSKRIDTSTDSDGNRSHKPVVTFRFEYNGQTHTADNIGPLTVSSANAGPTACWIATRSATPCRPGPTRSDSTAPS